MKKQLNPINKTKIWTQLSYPEKIKRWEHVQKVLQNLTPHERRKHFNMGGWAEKTPCGTVACAAGHCGFDPWFRKRGFYLGFKEVYDYEYDIDKNKDVRVKSLQAVAKKLNHRGMTEGISFVVGKFFGYDGAESIFYDSTNRSVGEVIKEVKEYIKELKEEQKQEQKE